MWCDKFKDCNGKELWTPEKIEACNLNEMPQLLEGGICLTLNEPICNKKTGQSFSNMCNAPYIIGEYTRETCGSIDDMDEKFIETL